MRSQTIFIHMRDISMNRTICSRHRLSDTHLNSHGVDQTSSILNDIDLSCPMFVKPPVDMIVRGNKIIITVEIPGARKEDISLEVFGRSLIVKAKYRERGSQEGDKVLMEERRRQNVCRYIYMPMTADLTRLEMARYKDGVLHIQVPETIPDVLTSRIIPVRG